MPKNFGKALHLGGFISKYIYLCLVSDFMCLKHLDALLSFTFITANFLHEEDFESWL